jgi:predicted GNAT family acetyltransferase
LLMDWAKASLVPPAAVAPAASTDVFVTHNETERVFTMLHDGVCAAKLLYNFVDEPSVTVMDIWHTETESRFRGKGLAAMLCVAAFRYAHSAGVLVRPSCTYVSDTFLPKNISLLPQCAGCPVLHSSSSSDVTTPATISQQIRVGQNSVIMADGVADDSSSEEEDEAAAEAYMLSHSFNLAHKQYRVILASDASNTKIRFRLANLCASRVEELPAGSSQARDMALEAVENFDIVLSSAAGVVGGGPGAGHAAAAAQGKANMELRLGVVSGSKRQKA